MNSTYILLREEFEELKHKPLSDLGYNIELSENNIYKWKVTLLGAKDTSYAEGIFLIELRFPQDYPHHGPRIYFLTPIYHPNVSLNDGNVAVNFIFNWKDSTRVREILTKLYAIFYDVNPNSPYSHEQAEEFVNNRLLYESKVKYFTKKYANIKSNKDIKFCDKWDFSLNKNISLCINLNGSDEFLMTFPLNEMLRDVIKKISDKYNRNLESEGCVLYIFNGKKLDNNKKLWENGLEDQSHVTIISGVHF